MTPGCFMSCWTVLTQSQGLQGLSGCPTSEWAGLWNKLGGNRARTADSSQPKGCSRSLGITLSSKGWGKGRGGCSQFLCLSSQLTDCYVGWSPAFLERANHLPAVGKRRMNFSACFPCACSFASLLKLSISSCKFFSLLPIRFSPLPLQGCKQAAERCLAVYWGWSTLPVYFKALAETLARCFTSR